MLDNDIHIEVRKIFNSQEIKDIENQIILLAEDNRFHHGDLRKGGVGQLLKVRKRMLDSRFRMDLRYKSLLGDFNGIFATRLIEMREKVVNLYNSLNGMSSEDEDVSVTGKCFLGYRYPALHPVQTERSKQMWNVLNGSIDDYMPLYDEALGFSVSVSKRVGPASVNQMLWLSDTRDNWNEHLNPGLTRGMGLIYAFHNLWVNLDFSIFDLLWVRQFNVEINVDYDYCTSPRKTLAHY